MRLQLILGVAMAIVAGPANASPKLDATASSTAPSIDYTSLPRFNEPGGHVLVNPGGFTSMPTAQDLKRIYPKEAKSQHLNGRASIQCRVTVEGRLNSCQAAAEAPTDFGFASAALALAPLFVMHPATYDGVAVPGYAVRIPISFNLFAEQPVPQLPPEPRRYAPIGSGISAPPELDSIVLPQGQLAILGVTTNGTIMSFLSLEDQVRAGDFVEVTLMSIARANLDWRGAMLVTRERFDCVNKTSELKARRDFDDERRTISWSWFNYNSAIPVRDNSETSEALFAVCKGKPVKFIVRGLDEAMGVARTFAGR